MLNLGLKWEKGVELFLKSKKRGDVARTLLILTLGLILGIVLMNLLSKIRLPKYRPKSEIVSSQRSETRKKKAKLSSAEKLDSLLSNIDEKVKLYQDKGLKFASLTEAEKFKTANYYRELKKELAYNDRERMRAKKRIYNLGGRNLIEAQELMEKGKYDLAQHIIKKTLRSGGISDPYIRMESYRYLAEISLKKGNVKEYALMMYKYFSQLEKEGVEDGKMEVIMKRKNDLKKVLERLKKE